MINMDRAVKKIASYLSCKNDTEFNIKRILIVKYRLKCIDDYSFYMCPICYKIFRSSDGLYLHIVKRHRELLEKIVNELKDL